MQRKRKCNTCGHRFHLDKSRVYTATEPRAVIGVIAEPPRSYDVTDCPKCGCQNTLAVRMPADKEDEPDESDT